jgi:hypothetical protein
MGEVAGATDDLRHRDLGVVVVGTPGHPAEELKAATWAAWKVSVFSRG